MLQVELHAFERQWEESRRQGSVISLKQEDVHLAPQEEYRMDPGGMDEVEVLRHPIPSLRMGHTFYAPEEAADFGFETANQASCQGLG